MTKPELDWGLINTVGERLGAGPEARKKWRQRGKVPFKWRILIVKDVGGLFSIDDFENSRKPAAKRARKRVGVA